MGGGLVQGGNTQNITNILENEHFCIGWGKVGLGGAKWFEYNKDTFNVTSLYNINTKYGRRNKNKMSSENFLKS